MTPGRARAGDGIILIGPMGAGKSSIARELARLTVRRWTDTDKLVAQRSGLTITEIFARHGEAHFRRMESEALSTLADLPGLIIATGGGIVTQTENVPILRGLGCVVYLTADEAVLFERVSRNQQRPLLQTDDPRATLHALVEQRHNLYADCAHLTVDTSRGTHAEIAQTVLTGARRFFAGCGLASSLP